MSKVVVTLETSSEGGDTEIFAAVENEVDQFNEFMVNLQDWKGAGPLAPQERALVSTYLLFKLKAGKEGK